MNPVSERTLVLIPRCTACGARLVLRNPPGGWTPEQRFCGTWYDHPPFGPADLPFGHTASALFESAALQAQLAAARGA